MIRRLINNKLFVTLVSILVVALGVIHAHWVFSGAALTSSDWPYFFRDLMSSWNPVHPFWINFDGLGRGISQGNFVFLFTIYGALARLGANFELISRLLFFIPVLVVAPVAAYLAVKQVIGHRVAAVMGAFVYSLNTYFIVIQGGHMHLAVTYALAPLVYLFAIRRTGFSYFWMFFILCIIGLYDIRMSLVILAFASILALFFKVRSWLDVRNYLLKMALGTGIFAAFNSFWALPLFFTQPGPFSRNVFDQAALNWVIHTDGFTLHHPFWSERGVTDFIFQLPPAYALVLPFFAFLPFAFKHVRHRKELLLFGVLALISMLFLMQQNSLLGRAYKVLYDSLPLMSMFRESTKMFFVTSFCFSMLVGFSVHELLHRYQEKRPWLLRGALAVLVAVILLPVSTYLTGNYVKAFRSESITPVMKEVNAIVTPDNDEQYRNLWVSRVPKFAHPTPEKPTLDALVLADMWGRYTDPFDSLSYLRQSNITGLLDFARIRYVIVPSDDIDVNYHHYNNYDADYYRDIVDAWGLRKVYEKAGSTIWENPKYKPHMYFTTDVIRAERLAGFSGLSDQQTSAYLFRDQNEWKQKNTLVDNIFTNTETQVFNPAYLQVQPGKISSSLQPPHQGQDLYVPQSDPTDIFAPLTNQPFKGGEISQFSPLIEGENLYKDGSFEEGKHFTLIDANNYDRTTMQHNRIAGRLVADATHGKRSLEITARRHIADLTQEIENFDKDAYYLLSFDYKYVAGPAPLVGLDPYEIKPTKRLMRLSTETPGKWVRYQAILRPGHFSDEAHLLIHVPTKRGQDLDSKTLVDNIQVYKLPFPPRAFLKTTQPTVPALPYTVTSSSATRRVLTVEGLTTPRMLVFSETFDPNWKLSIRMRQFSASPKMQLPESQHLITNGYANGWWIDPSKLPNEIKNEFGRYEITLEYMPQRWFWVGGLVTATITVSALSFYAAMWYRRRRSKHSWMQR